MATGTTTLSKKYSVEERPGGGNDDLPWLYTQSLQNIEGC
jgi:hypothetical protein